MMTETLDVVSLYETQSGSNSLVLRVGSDFTV